MTEEFPIPRASRFDPIASSWRILAAPQTLMALMGCLAVLLVAGSLLPQISLGVDADPQTWLVVQTGFWEQQNGLFRALGLDDIYHSPWFHLLLALLGLCLFVRLIESLDMAWRASVGQNWSQSSFVFWGRWAPRVYISSDHSPESVQTLVRGFFARRGFRWTNVPGLRSANAVASRRTIFLWAQPLIFLGLLLTLVGLAITGTWGWQHQDWRPAPGDRRGLGHGMPYVVRLDAFDRALSSEGTPGFYSTISWLEGEDVVRRDVVGTGKPATYGGATVRQTGYAPVARISVGDQKGPMALQLGGTEPSVSGEVEVVFPSLDAQPLILIPGQDRFLALALEAECAGSLPALRVAIMGADGETLSLFDPLLESGTLSAGGLQITAGLAYRPVLRADHWPAMGLVLAGMALAMTAFVVGWLVPPRLVWIASQARDEGGTRIQALVPPAGWGRFWLRQMADLLEEALAGDD